MKLKRNIFAFLVMVFILSGCVSDVSLTGTIENTNQTNVADGMLPSQLLHRQHNEMASVRAISNFTKEASAKVEIEKYATSKTLNSKLVKQASFQASLQKLVEKSDVEQYTAPKPKVQTVAASTPQEGQDTSVFYPRTTLYGVDCYGCNVSADGTGHTATGIALNPNIGVLQSDGTWLSGLTYDGYYIIAADRSIPFYSIVEISNHGLSGMGFSPDQPIQAIVLDRGGGVNGAHIDLYIGSETNVNQIHSNGSQPVAKVIRYGR